LSGMGFDLPESAVVSLLRGAKLSDGKGAMFTYNRETGQIETGKGPASLTEVMAQATALTARLRTAVTGQREGAR
ncbi:hypothetical protein CYD30_29260, partial [Kosakonia cowanii]